MNTKKFLTSTYGNSPISPAEIENIKSGLANIESAQAESTETSTITQSDSGASEIQRCLQLLEEGKTRVKLMAEDAVIILGMTGSGKTTLVKFLATNNDDLKAEEVAENVGEYTIADSEQKISSNSFVSQTIFPELYVDPDTQIALYDSSGFSDTRGLSVDVAGSYLLRKIVVESPKIRLVLTANFSSLRRGSDRGDFLELLKHVSHLVKNIGPYAESIALVVTKVDNQMVKKGDYLELVPDETIVQNVAKFLSDFKKDIPKVAEGATALNLSFLVDALLTKKNSSYERIAIFRRPDEPGPLNKMQLLQENKAAIKKVIRDNLRSVSPNPADFGFAISEASKNRLSEVAQKINENIGAQIGREYAAKMRGQRRLLDVDVYERKQIMQKYADKLKNWLENLRLDSSLRTFLDELSAIGSESTAERLSLTDAEKNRILSKGEYLPFLEAIRGKKFDNSIFAWRKGLKSYVDYAEDGWKWYDFLINLHQVLSSYPVQLRYADFSRLHEKKVTELTDGDFVRLMEFCNSLTKKFEDFQSFAMDETRRTQLNRVLELTLAPQNSEIYTDDSYTYEIRGKFVKLSDHLTDQKLLKAKFVYILATDKLFIDVDVKRVEMKLQGLTLVAPTWEVIGDVRTINLNGEDGCCAPTSRASAGDQFWRSGRHGQPGAPGESAANFLGLAMEVINADRLQILANGGQGSAGQDGGNGGDGSEGASPITKNPWGCSSNNVDRFISSKLGGFFQPVYCVYGEPGTDGGAGGNGGIGGYGGKAGKVTMRVFGNASRVGVEATDGPAGKPGSGGEGGQGGKAGRSWNHQKILWWWKNASCSKSQNLASEYGDCASSDYLRQGKQGERGVSGAHWEGGRLPQLVDDIKPAAVIATYVDFLRVQASKDIVHRLPKTRFLQKLKNDETLSEGFGQAAPIAQGYQQKRLKRNPYLEQVGVMKDCFRVSQWPVTSRISQEDTSSDTSVMPQVSIEFSLNNALLLTDLLIRKLSKSKPNYWKYCTIDYSAAKFCAAEILSSFENILSSTVADNNILVDIDPIPILEKLENAIINGSRENIGRILIDSLENESPHQKEELYRHLQKALDIN